MRLRWIFVVLIVLTSIAVVAAQKKRADGRAEVAILGTYHFENPKLDYAKFEVSDVLTPAKQKEIAAVVKKLAKFKPTKIAVEWTPSRSDAVNADFRKYVDGKFELSRNEVHQLGFRLAKESRLPRVYLIDQAGQSGETNIGDAMGYARSKSPQFFEKFNRDIGSFVTMFERMQKEDTIPEILRFMNSPEALHMNHTLYVQMTEIGAGDNYVGADAVAAWYRRNLKIYANLAAIAEPGDRILVLFGQGHKPILEQIAIDSEKIRIVDVRKYL